MSTFHLLHLAQFGRGRPGQAKQGRQLCPVSSGSIIIIVLLLLLLFLRMRNSIDGCMSIRGLIIPSHTIHLAHVTDSTSPVSHCPRCCSQKQPQFQFHFQHWSAAAAAAEAVFISSSTTASTNWQRMLVLLVRARQ